MRRIGRGVAHGGTYTAHSVSLAAAEKTLEILDETDALARIADYGTRLRNGMSSVLKSRGVAHSFVGHPSMSGLYFAITTFVFTLVLTFVASDAKFTGCYGGLIGPIFPDFPSVNSK